MAQTTVDAKEAMEKVERVAKAWIEPVARAGYASKGFVYFLIGVLAVMAAFNLGGSIAGPKEALQTLQPKTFGKVLLAVVGVGLCCYAVWRFVQSIYDPEGKGKKLKGLLIRTGYAGSGIIHGLLAWAVIQMILGGSGSSSRTSEAGLTARLMSQPFGIWLVGIVGVIIAGVGSYHIFRGLTGAFKKRLNFSPVREKTREFLCRTCQFGLIARGVAFTITAWFFIRSAMHYNPREAGGLSEALSLVAAQSYGPWLLGAMGFGLAAYGVYAFVEARFRQINV
jgi:hypothetical protein